MGKKSYIEEKYFTLARKADREYLNKSLEVVFTKLIEGEKALGVATKEADKQYQHLNNLRDSMVLDKVYKTQIKSLNDKYDTLMRLVYIGVGIIAAIQLVILYR